MGLSTGDNVCDNIEQVLIADATNGWYTIRVRHAGVLSNGVQDVSIIITGNAPTNAPDFEITDAGAVGTNGLVELAWPGVVGAIYEVTACTNLLVSNDWSEVSETISASLEELSWTDTDATNETIRFYRVERRR